MPICDGRVVGMWRESLAKVNQKAAQSLADPAEYENLFPGLKDAIKTEQFLKPERKRVIPASDYPSVTVSPLVFLVFFINIILLVRVM